jgi:hypothetical protein
MGLLYRLSGNQQCPARGKARQGPGWTEGLSPARARGRWGNAKGYAIHIIFLIVLLTLASIAQAGDVRCTTREDAAFKRYRTDVTKVPQGDKAPRGWPVPGKAPR